MSIDPEVEKWYRENVFGLPEQPNTGLTTEEIDTRTKGSAQRSLLEANLAFRRAAEAISCSATEAIAKVRRVVGLR